MPRTNNQQQLYIHKKKKKDKNWMNKLLYTVEIVKAK